MKTELEAFKSVARKLGVSPRDLWNGMKMAQKGIKPSDVSSGDADLERFLEKMDK